MSARFVFATLFEIALVAFVVYGLFNEAKFSETERRVFRYLKRLIHTLAHGGRASEVQF